MQKQLLIFLINFRNRNRINEYMGNQQETTYDAS